MAAINLFDHECDHCGAIEERVFEDSHTRKELCLECLIRVAPRITNSPRYEGDNLNAVLAEDQQESVA